MRESPEWQEARENEPLPLIRPLAPRPTPLPPPYRRARRSPASHPSHPLQRPPEKAEAAVAGELVATSTSQGGSSQEGNRRRLVTCNGGWANWYHDYTHCWECASCPTGQYRTGCITGGTSAGTCEPCDQVHAATSTVCCTSRARTDSRLARASSAGSVQDDHKHGAVRGVRQPGVRCRLPSWVSKRLRQWLRPDGLHRDSAGSRSNAIQGSRLVHVSPVCGTPHSLLTHHMILARRTTACSASTAPWASTSHPRTAKGCVGPA